MNNAADIWDSKIVLLLLCFGGHNVLLHAFNKVKIGNLIRKEEPDDYWHNWRQLNLPQLDDFTREEAED